MRLPNSRTVAAVGTGMRDRIVAILDVGNPSTPWVLASNRRSGDGLPAGTRLCQPTLKSFLATANAQVTDRTGTSNGTFLAVTRPCAPTDPGARPFCPDDLLMKTAVLGSRHSAYAEEVKALRELGLASGSGDFGKVILTRCRAALKTIIPFLPSFRVVIDRFGLLLGEAGFDLFGLRFVPPAAFPGGFPSALTSFLLSDDPETRFALGKVDFAVPGWFPFYDDPTKQAAFARLIELYRATLMGDARQFAGQVLPDGRSVVKLVESILAAEEPDAKPGAKPLPERFRTAHAAMQQLLGSMRSHADRCEVLRWFLKQLYRSNIVGHIPAGLLHQGARDKAVAKAVLGRDPNAETGLARAIERGSAEEQKKYAAAFRTLPGKLWPALLAADDDALSAALKDLPEQTHALVRRLRDDPVHGPFLAELGRMARDPRQEAVAAGVRAAVEVIASDMVLPRLFGGAGLTLDEVVKEMKSDLVTCTLLTLTVGRGAGTDVARLVDRHPLDVDPSTGTIRGALDHAASLMGDLVVEIGLNERVRQTVVERLPKLAGSVDERPVGQLSEAIPLAAAEPPDEGAETSCDVTPAHPAQFKQLVTGLATVAVERMLPASQSTPEPGESPLVTAVREQVQASTPELRDADGKWKIALVKATADAIARQDDLRVLAADRKEARDRTVAQICRAYEEHGERLPALRATAERFIVGMFLSADSRIALGTPETSHLRLLRDLMLCDPERPDEIAANLTLTQYFTVEQIEKLSEIRATLEWGSKARYPMARLVSDLYGLQALFEAARKTGAEVLIFVGSAKAFLAQVQAENLGPATAGGLFRSGKLMAGEALPGLALVVGETALGAGFTKADFIRALRDLPQSETANGQSYLLPPAYLSLGHADDNGDWIREGRELSDAALGIDGSEPADEVSAHVVGPSPVLGVDAQIVVPAAFLLAARTIGADCGGFVGTGAGDVSGGRFHALTAVNLNTALDRAIWGPLVPEKDGPNTERAVAADCYCHLAATADALVEKAGAAPAPTWANDVSPAFILTPQTTNKAEYQAAANLLNAAVVGGRARRFALARDAAGGWVVRIATKPEHALDTDDGKGAFVAAYPAPHFAPMRRRAGLSPEPPIPAPPVKP